jgi:hypothetical protein
VVFEDSGAALEQSARTAITFTCDSLSPIRQMTRIAAYVCLELPRTRTHRPRNVSGPLILFLPVRDHGWSLFVFTIRLIRVVKLMTRTWRPAKHLGIFSFCPDPFSTLVAIVISSWMNVWYADLGFWLELLVGQRWKSV